MKVEKQMRDTRARKPPKPKICLPDPAPRHQTEEKLALIEEYKVLSSQKMRLSLRSRHRLDLVE